MRAITKSTEPASLTAHRQMRYSNYDNYADKDALRHALLTEQRGICCYCMGRIHNGPATMKIEHWQCQHRLFSGAAQLPQPARRVSGWRRPATAPPALRHEEG